MRHTRRIKGGNSHNKTQRINKEAEKVAKLAAKEAEKQQRKPKK